MLSKWIHSMFLLGAAPNLIRQLTDVKFALIHAVRFFCLQIPERLKRAVGSGHVVRLDFSPVKTTTRIKT